MNLMKEFQSFLFKLLSVSLPNVGCCLGADALLLPLAVWLSFWLRLAHPFHPNFLIESWWILPGIWLIGLPLYAFSGQYKGLTRYVGSRSLYQLALRNGLLVILLVACG